MYITGIILTAGNSTRYGKDKNKNLEFLKKKRVIEYSIDAFDKNQYIKDIALVVKEEELPIFNTIIKKIDINKKLYIVIGGNTRSESVYNAITKIKSDIVIIQDGARPLIKQKYINECIETILKEQIQGVTIAVKSKDTIKIVDCNNMVVNSTNRNYTWIIQTPQCFYREILLDSYNKINDFSNITDDCMVLESNNYKVKLIPGEYTNIKLTTPEDMELLKYFINKY